MFFKKFLPTKTPELHTISVGKRHPYLTPPAHGGQSMGLETGHLSIDMFYTLPIDWEVSALAGACIACGLHLTPDVLVPVFVFQGTTGQWAVHAPLVASDKEVEAWIRHDTNLATFTLMEAGSGIVRQIRHIGLDADFMRMMKGALAYVPHPASTAAYEDLFERVGSEGLWLDAKKWVWDEGNDTFKPV